MQPTEVRSEQRARERSRDSARSRRKRDVRAKTINVMRELETRPRALERQLAIQREIYPESTRRMLPVLRAECKDTPRPCPHVSCKHHLYLDVSLHTGSLKYNFPDVDVDAMDQLPATCALDVAERGGVTLEELGAIMNLTRERIRQIEVKAIVKVRVELERLGIDS